MVYKWRSMLHTKTTVGWVEITILLHTCNLRSVPNLWRVELHTAHDLRVLSCPSCFRGYFKKRWQLTTYFNTESPNSSKRSREKSSQHLNVVSASRIYERKTSIREMQVLNKETTNTRNIMTNQKTWYMTAAMIATNFLSKLAGQHQRFQSMHQRR